MSQVINPHMAVLVKGASDWWSDDEPTRLEMSVDVVKDLDGEPNAATVEIYNLNDDTRMRILDLSVLDVPIEIHFAPFGSDELVKCFVGEIATAVSTPERPGFVTRLECQSQRWQSRNKYVDKKTYEQGTTISQIIDEFVAAIDLPVKQVNIPTGSILLAQSFSGPAFMLLQKFLWSYAMFCYILDGVLYISSVYEPPLPSVVQITQAMMITAPQPRERTDAVDVELHTVTDTNNINPFAKRTRRNKRAWKKQALSRNDYAEYDAIDDVIHGVECETLGTPSIQPDSIVKFEGDDNQYRVQVVTHRGNTRQGFSTIIEADLYEGEELYSGAFDSDSKSIEELETLAGL